MKPHRGNLILALGILSLIMCAPIGIAAWLMGNGDLKLMNSGQMDPEGRSLTSAGRICGMIATILLILGVLCAILVLGLGIIGAAASAH